MAVAAIVAAVALIAMLPLGKATTEGDVVATVALVIGLLAAQGCVRVALAVKSAAMPDVLSGKDLLQGNGLSQAEVRCSRWWGSGSRSGGGAARLARGRGRRRPAGGGRDGREAHASRRGLRARDQLRREASQVLRNIVAGVRELAARPPAAVGLSSFQMLRYQFWGFVLFTFALYAKNLVEGGDASSVALGLSGGAACSAACSA